MSEDLNAQIMKSGVCWFEMTIGRNKKGIELFVRATPELESFMASMGSGDTDDITAYGRDWCSDISKLRVYRITKDVALGTFSLARVCEPLDGANQRDLRVNLSFLRFVGIGEPAGITFTVIGPFSKAYITKLSASISAEVKELIRQYIVPVQVNLRISSQVA